MKCDGIFHRLHAAGFTFVLLDMPEDDKGGWTAALAQCYAILKKEER